jgi:disulfide bond formation protein DsbB
MVSPRAGLRDVTCYHANTCQLDKLVGLAMLVAASVVFLYYTIWTLVMARFSIVSVKIKN